MRRFLASSLLLVGGFAAPGIAGAEDKIVIEEFERGIPVQPAILTRRYGAVVTEDEVVQQEFEAGYGASNLFKFVHWRRANRPFGWYGGFGFPAFGPRYFVGFGPRYMNYYPTYGYGYGMPYWGYGGYGGYYGAMPYRTFYAPPVYYGGFGGCYYW